MASRLTNTQLDKNGFNINALNSQRPNLTRKRIIQAAALSAIAVAVAGCGLYDPPPFDPQSLQEPYRQQAQDVPTEHLNPLPTGLEPAYPSTEPSRNGAPGAATEPADEYFGGGDSATQPATGPALGTEPTVMMSLQEMVHRAVANNHDVHVAGFGPAIEATRTVEAEAQFDATAFANVGVEHKYELTAGQILTDPVTAITNNVPTFFTESDTYTATTGLKQTLPSGTQVQLQYQAQYQYLLPRVYIENPFYDNTLTLQVTQPLLRQSGYAVNQARIVVSRDNQKVSLLEFRKQLEDTASQIERYYWQLQQALADVKTLENLLDTTAQTYNVLQNRFQLHIDVSKLELEQAQTSLESRRAALIQKKNQARDLSEKLKQLMGDTEFPASSDILLLPADQPIQSPITFDLADQINSGLENRFELAEQIYKIDIADVTAQVGKNNLLPLLNFVGSVGSQGLGDNEGEAFRTQMVFGHIDYSAGLQFEYPIGNRAAEAIWKRVLLQRMQAIEQYRSLIDQVTFDVKVSVNDESAAWDRMIAARRARYAAAAALRSIQDRENSGEPFTPTFVQLKLDLQDSFANAEQDEHDAVAQYNISILELERSKGTLLRYLNVALEENPALFPTKKWMASENNSGL
jgi:outer membrane protein